MSASTEDLTGLTGWVADVVSAFGPIGVGLLVAVESIYPPTPSEVVLPVAGFVASQGRMSLRWALVAANIGFLVGAWTLYWLGARVGVDRLRRWAERMLLEVRDVERAVGWFDRHGGTAVLIGRCVPVVRSLVSIPAGVPARGLPVRSGDPAGTGTRGSRALLGAVGPETMRAVSVALRIALP